ncbi:DNA polymerase III subunit delta [candidate division KSB1 bacterium]|nr:DNA polymerase III subunit delta [candidate division KSB1 bacterium]
MTEQSIINDISKGKIAPVYLLHGEEKFSLDEVAAKIIDACIDESVKDFNFDIFYGSESDSGKILDVAKSYPMMAQRRTVVVKEANKLAAAHLGYLAAYAESPVKTTCLILIFPVSGSKGKAFAALKKNAVECEFKQLYDSQVPDWINEYVTQLGREINAQAVYYLHGFVGNSKLNIVNELEKVFLNIGDRKKIELNDVQEIVGFSRGYNVFHLQDAIGEKNLSKALLIIDELLEHGENTMTIIIRLANHFSNLLKLNELLRQRKSDKEIQQLTGLNFYFLKNIKSQATRFNRQKIMRNFQLLEEADYQLKTSAQPVNHVMQLLVYQLIR